MVAFNCSTFFFLLDTLATLSLLENDALFSLKMKHSKRLSRCSLGRGLLKQLATDGGVKNSFPGSFPRYSDCVTLDCLATNKGLLNRLWTAFFCTHFVPLLSQVISDYFKFRCYIYS